MNHRDENPWQLFESVRGWRLCSKRLDDAMLGALKELDKAMASGHSPFDAARRAASVMKPVLIREQRFGAFDSEGCFHTAKRINEHLTSQHSYSGEYIERFDLFR